MIPTWDMSSDTRPPRRIPTRAAIFDWWQPRIPVEMPEVYELLDGDLDWPRCWACGSCAERPEWEHMLRARDRWQASPLERAHLADRVYNGLDTPANLALLCCWCHGMQPAARHAADSIRWIRGRAALVTVMQRYVVWPNVYLHLAEDPLEYSAYMYRVVGSAEVPDGLVFEPRSFIEDLYQRAVDLTTWARAQTQDLLRPSASPTPS